MTGWEDHGRRRGAPAATSPRQPPPDVAELLGLSSADPIFKCRKLFKFWPWSKQREILWSVRTEPRTAVPAANGVGKTAAAAHAVLDFITEGPCRVVTTAPIWSQVEDLLWREIAVAYGKAKIPVGGELFKTRLEFAPDWFAVGFSTDEPERFQGHHAPRLLLVIDEASGVGEAIYGASKGFLTASQGARVLLISNPTRPMGSFFRACRETSPYNVIRVSAFDSPNVTGERVPPHVALALPTQQWIDEMAEEYGVDSTEYRMRVLGLFAQTLGRPFFNGDNLDRADDLAVDALMIGRIIGEPVQGAELRFVSDLSSPKVTLYELPHPDQTYVIFADVAGEGLAVEEEEARKPTERTDASCATVISLDTGRICAVFHDRCDEASYAIELARLGWLYKHAEIAVEATGGYGALVIGDLVRTYRYRKLFRRTKPDQPGGRLSSVYGWDTSSQMRPSMLNALAQQLKNDPAALRSRDLIDQMRVFTWNDSGKRAQAQSGSHDDRVLSAAGGFLLREIRSHTSPKIVIPGPKPPLLARPVDAASDVRAALPGSRMRRGRHLTVSQRAHATAAATSSHRTGD